MSTVKTCVRVALFLNITSRSPVDLFNIKYFVNVMAHGAILAANYLAADWRQTI